MTTPSRSVAAPTALGALVDAYGAPAILDVSGLTRMTGTAVVPVAVMQVSNPSGLRHRSIIGLRAEPKTPGRSLNSVEGRRDKAGPIRVPTMAYERC